MKIAVHQSYKTNDRSSKNIHTHQRACPKTSADSGPQHSSDVLPASSSLPPAVPQPLLGPSPATLTRPLSMMRPVVCGHVGAERGSGPGG
jgi:hypothetical protein